MKALKQELQVNGNDWLGLLVIQLAVFIVGIIMVNIIIALDVGAETYFNMGMLFAILVAVFAGFIYDGLLYQTRFQLAVSMGRSRRGLLLSHFVFTPLRTLALLGTAWVLGKMELLLYGLIYPTLSNEVDFYIVYQWEFILPAVILVTILGLFVAAIYGRFGRKGGMVMYFGFMIVILGFSRLSALFSRLHFTEFGRVVMRFIVLADSLEPWTWIGAGVIVAAALLAYSVRQMLRQPVQF